ncbi:MAG: Ig-like domain-containing protein, partial [Rhodoglobus sp.]|nr:Ig-like domain-containing protein [Rhodoglobus sp.]
MSPVSSAISRRGYVYALSPDAAGRVLIGGYFQSVNGVRTPPLARLLPDGSVDSTFAFATAIASLVTEIVPLADGRFVVLGGNSSAGVYRLKLTRIEAYGAHDTSFAPNPATDFAPSALAVAPGGKLILAGRARGAGAVFSGRIFRIDTDGSTDSSFDAGNHALLDGNTTGVTVQSDGKVVVVGSFSAFGGAACVNIVRLNSDGTVDGTFASGAGIGGGWPQYLRASVRGTMVASGSFSSYAGTAVAGVVVIQPDGSLDPFFQASAGWAYSDIALQDDDQIFAWRLADFYWDPFGTNDTEPHLVRLQRTGATGDGMVDPAFRLAGLRLTDTLLALAPGEDGHLFYSMRNTGAVHRTSPTFSPVIDTHPLPRASTVGGTTTFSVAALAVPAASFQWRKNGVDLTGSTGTALTLSALKPTDAGRYDVVVTNTLGHTTSMLALLTVNPNAAPLVSLTAPAVGSTVRVGLTPPDTIAVTANAADADGTVTQVEFFANGVAFGTATSPPFTANFTASSVGNYALTAVATDDFGNRTTSAVVSVSAVSGSDPFVTLSAPVEGSTSSINVPLILTATATPSSARSISSVQFLANGVPISSPDTSFPYSVTWVPLHPGVYALTAAATDNLAIIGTSAPVNITITPGFPPSVSLTNPPAGASVVVNTPISLTAEASAKPSAVITHVQFYINGILVGTDPAFPFGVTFTWTQTGTYV